MISRTVWIFFVMLLSAESRPFYIKSRGSTSERQAVQNLDGHYPVYYRFLPFRVQQSSGMFSDFSSSPVRRPSLHFTEMLKRDRKSKIPSRVSFNEDLQDLNQQTAQMVDQFGQQVRATVQQYEKAHGQSMQKVKEILEQFELSEVKDRLKKTLMDKNGLFEKLHSIGWHGKYIGVLYDTRNDDHTIVKKPGVDGSSFSQPNTRIPVSVLVASTVQSTPMPHPAIPEVTTSVDFHQVSEPTRTIDGYVLPITWIPTNTAQVIETTDISNSIDEDDRPTIIHLPLDTLYLIDKTPSTTTSATKGVILDENTDGVTFGETNGSTAEIDTVFIPLDASTEIEDEKFTGSTIRPEATTELYATVFDGASIETTFQTERTFTEPSTPRITTPTIYSESITAEIGPTFPSTITIGDEENTSSIIHGYTTTTEIIPTVPSTSFTQVTPGAEGASSPPPESETTTVLNERTMITERIFTSTSSDPETTSEFIFTFPLESVTEEPLATDGISTTTDYAAALSSTNSPQTEVTKETITGVESSFTSTIPPAKMASTVAEPLTTIDSGETATTWEEISSTGSTVDSGTTTEVLTVSSTVTVDRTTTVTEKLTTEDPPSDYSRIETERTPQTVSTFPATTATQATTTFAEMSTTSSSLYDSSIVIDAGRTTEIVSPSSYTVPTETTMALDELFTTKEFQVDSSMIKTTEDIATFSVAVPTKATTTSKSEITTLSDVLPRFEDTYSTGPSIRVETTTIPDTTCFSAMSTEAIMTGTERLITIDSGFEGSTIDMESTTQIISTSPSPISTETTTIFEETSAATDSSSDSFTIDPGTTKEFILPFYYTSSIKPSMAFDGVSVTTTETSIDSLIIDEPSTEVISTFSVTVPTEATTTSASEITTLLDVLPRFEYNYLTSSTIDMESTTELAPSTQKATTLDEISATTNLPIKSYTIDTGTTTEVILPFPYIVPSAEINIALDQISTATTESSIDSLNIDEETSIEVDSTFSSTIATGIGLDSDFDSSINDVENTTESVSTSASIISTEKATTLEKISTTTDAPFESSTIDEETSTVITTTEKITSLEEISQATEPSTNGVTDDGETTTEIGSTFSPRISTDTSVEPTPGYDIEENASSEDLEGNDIPVLPELARAATEEPDVKTLLNLIPLIIEELRQNNLTREEVYTLRQVFGNIWPLLEEEAKRKPGELVNEKLAILLLQVGQRLSNTDKPEPYNF